jgi:serine/threonine protein phosphatase PrpC
VILACDGVWDVMSNQEVGDFVVDHVKRFEKEEEYLVSDAPSVLAEVGDELLKHCLDKGSSDNMSVLIIDLCPKYDDRRIGKEESIDLMNTSRTLNFGVV